MPRFYFHLRAAGRVHRDPDGTELPDLAMARAHAAAVAQELMDHADAGTRHWSICVENEHTEREFDLYFPDVALGLAAYPPHMQMLVSKTSRRLGALTDALDAVRATLVETRMLMARAQRKPQLVYAHDR